jgi:ribonucleotide reductase alpha subunit
LSGAISKTVNMPKDTTVKDIADAYFWGWQLGLKAIAIYRDGSKQSQPLSTKSEAKKAEDAAIEKIVGTSLAVNGCRIPAIGHPQVQHRWARRLHQCRSLPRWSAW